MAVARYQNPNSQVQEGTAVAHTIHGTPASGLSVNPEAQGVQDGRIRAVPSPIFRDYKPPLRRDHDKGHELCSFEGCKAYPSKKWPPYCAGHAVTMGLRANPQQVHLEKIAHDDAG